ncbi:hypothetical protein DEU56DRAFT_353312 [Suillus clintonianus]|uniref:uncharacterized protein n=1 Tax=Suillus clintonianus TaxID=1904413 RepID=UPI001B86B861|nr:uncharacterized protein DEU56DRAFT_353312 [Suillus clintonianus]KAG2137024.1 hypothetical protein DEU56DRAFT_353312 [Suillus clintonianus]
MEYSVDDVTAARTLQYLGYICVSMTIFWTYDYVCALHKEWEFLHRSRWTRVKALYIITRYVPCCLITTDLYLNFAPTEDPNKCRMLINIYACFGVISLTCSECFFVLRTYALSNSNRIVLVAMLTTLVAIIMLFIGIGFTAISTSYVMTSAIPGFKGCYRISHSVQFFIPFLLLLVFQLGLASHTLIRAIQNWRSAKGHLHAILLKHNIFYYACSLPLSAVNVLVPLLFSDSAYYSLVQDLQVFILAILATRMHLHLWHTSQCVEGSEALVWISLSNVSPVDITV